MPDSVNTIGSSDWYEVQRAEANAQRAAAKTEATLGMNDFIKLLVAQLQNQDMMNPMDNTEFIAQMATFSTLTSMNNMVEQTTTSYAVSLIGKDVTAAVLDQSGRLETIEGVVTGISLFDGEPKIYIGDRSFTLQSVMTVGKLREGASTGGTDSTSTGGTDSTSTGGTDGTSTGGTTDENAGSGLGSEV